MNLFILFWISVFTIFSGKPAAKTEVYLELNKQLVAFQATGEQGKASFRYLDAGSYSLSLIFPQQEGKYLKEKPKHQTLTKATYNEQNRTYYYQGQEGYFSIKFFGLSKITKENFKAVFKEEKEEEDSYNVIAEFGAHNKGAALSIQVKVITAAQFKKATDKIGQDISTQSIRGIK